MALFASAVIAVVALTVCQDTFRNEDPSAEEGGQGLSHAETISCSQFIAEGEVA
ncbi:hypothetical protein SAMN05216270_10522 [Glycomyces harbinensis]|uniref:Uncharacterized protein n=2 Tax=Glycomyces harbinensis TaxID=58114 RepID=A0A1G6VMC2_9ACTN|nr:hypothetical protein SAMN05216270_10522 [Glycomyces harbinensis]